MAVALYRLAQQRLRKRFDESRFTYAFRTIEQNGVRQTRAQLLQLQPIVVQPGKNSITHAQAVINKTMIWSHYSRQQTANFVLDISNAAGRIQHPEALRELRGTA